MWSRKKQVQNPTDRRNPRQPSSSTRVNSYYTASKKQINTFELTNTTYTHAVVKKNRQRLFRQYGLGIIGGILAIVAFVAVMTMSSSASISIDGGGSYRTSSEYEKIVSDALSKRPQNKIKFLLDADGVGKEIKANVPEAYNVMVYAPLFGRNAEVILTTAAPFAVVLQDKAPTLVMSDRGALAVEASRSTVNASQLPTITNSSGTDFAAGDQLFKPEEMASLNELQFQFTKGNSQSAPTAYILPASPREIHVTESTYIVKFSLQPESNVTQQYGALRAVQTQLQAQSKTPQEYIDVRLASKVFVK